MQTQFSQAFGGPLLKKANAREPRPFNRKADLHLSLWARNLGLRKNFLSPKKKRAIHIILRRQARRHSVKMKWFSLEKNRLHVVIQTERQKNVSNFLRSICGLIARQILEVEKGQGKGAKPKLWLCRPLSSWLTKKKFSLIWVQDFVGFVSSTFGADLSAGLSPPHSVFALTAITSSK